MAAPDGVTVSTPDDFALPGALDGPRANRREVVVSIAVDDAVPAMRVPEPVVIEFTPRDASGQAPPGDPQRVRFEVHVGDSPRTAAVGGFLAVGLAAGALAVGVVWRRGGK